MYKKLEFSHKKIFILNIASVFLGALSILLGKFLLLSITAFTNLFWFQEFSLEKRELIHLTPEPVFILIPAIGGLLIGLLARYASKGILGHGIPDVMENILTKESKIPRRMTILKPLSAAISIGSGGPFGAEAPIIATGGAAGSWMGRHLYFSEHERKILLAAGASAGMTAVFGSPLAAVFLSIELLLFEFSAISFLPVLLAVSTAQTIRYLTGHIAPEFPVENLSSSFTLSSSAFYLAAGAITGAFSCVVTKLCFFFEDMFEKLPLHWMWWPAIGGLAVGLIGYLEPRSLGVGYGNIAEALSGKLLLGTAVVLLVAKLASWAIALGSHTAGGTLAPLLTFGSAFGVILSHFGNYLFPEIGISPQITAIVCMSCMFSGATRAVLTGTIFALEATGASVGVAPLLLGNSAAFLISLWLMDETIMTEKIVKKGIHVPNEYFSQKKSNE